MKLALKDAKRTKLVLNLLYRAKTVSNLHWGPLKGGNQVTLGLGAFESAKSSSKQRRRRLKE